ncbi:MAG TPA: transglutaminase domain-containing protein, partial [Firmicutes bacterium]|nr:transglutaminase domain-containing protein [Bacillota bacterium]
PASCLLLVLAGFVAYLVNPLLAARILQFLLTFLPGNVHVRFIAIVAAITLLCLLLVFKVRRNLLLLFLVGLAVFPPLWYTYIDSAYSTAVAYALGWFLLLSYRQGSRIWEELLDREKNELRSGWLKYTGTTLFLMLLFALLLPKSIPPVPLPSFQMWVDNTFPFVASLRGGQARNVRGTGGEYGLHVAGFGQAERLGGPLVQDDIVLLEVKATRPLYLRGTVRRDYTGMSWLGTGGEAPWEPAAAEGVLQTYLRPVKVTITHTRLLTSTVFTPFTAAEIRNIKAPLFVTAGGGVFTAEAVPLKNTYTVFGAIPGYRGDFSALESDESSDGLAAWTALPGRLPSRVAELAAAVTAGKTGVYAKMKALEHYLRTNFTYSETASPLPDETDFVDFFLFTEKRGYCTSFASALAVMARTLGIPTRYVQGFALPSSPDDDNIYRVRGIHAHAWVEAYLPGIGWLPFEATPGFPTNDTLPALEPLDPSPPDREEPPLPEEPPEADRPQDREQLPAVLRAAGLILAAACVLLVLALAALLVKRRLLLVKNLQRVQTLPPRRQAVVYYNLALAMLEGLGLGKIPGETPREYSRRIHRQIYDWKLDFRQITEGINLALYTGEDKIPEWLPEESKAFFTVMFKRYTVQAGRLAAFINIYLRRRYLSDSYFRQFWP